jgi:hypothetical protein
MTAALFLVYAPSLVLACCACCDALVRVVDRRHADSGFDPRPGCRPLVPFTRALSTMQACIAPTRAIDLHNCSPCSYHYSLLYSPTPFQPTYNRTQNSGQLHAVAPRAEVGVGRQDQAAAHAAWHVGKNCRRRVGGQLSPPAAGVADGQANCECRRLAFNINLLLPSRDTTTLVAFTLLTHTL